MNIIKDTDHTINQTLCNEDGTAVDLNDVTGIIAKVFQKGIEIDKFSFVTQAGYNPIVRKTPFTDGIVEFYLNAEKLRQGIDSIELFYEIKYEVVNVNFDNNTEEKSTGWISLGKLEKTKLENNTFA